MKLKNVSLQKLLLGVFAILMILVITLGFVSVYQSQQLNDQTETLYSHPLTVRNAFFEMKAAALDSGIELRNLLNPENEPIQDDLIAQINLDYAVIEDNLITIQESYLGPLEDIENLNSSYQIWKSYRNQTINIILDGDYDTASERVTIEGEGEDHREAFFSAIEVIDVFSAQMANQLFEESKSLALTMTIAMVTLLVAIFGFTMGINGVLARQILKPIKAITHTTKILKTGDYSARVEFESNNEFGDMCYSMNEMIGRIQENDIIQNKINSFSESIVKANSPDVFPNALIYNLCEITNSQAGFFYLANEQTGLMEKTASFGFPLDVASEIDLNNVKKEFGFSIHARKVKIINNIPDKDMFIMNTTYGDFYPKEIMTIPIISEDSIIALISLANTSIYGMNEVEIVNQILEMITSRIEGMKANLKIKEFLIELEQQNQELEQQQNEMESMNQELEQQNIELEIQRNQLDEASTHKTNFLSTMSHELRTPLNSVIALSGVLSRQLEGKISDEEHSYLDVIERNGKNLLLLINDILDISRIESGRTEIIVSQFKPCTVLDELLENISHQASEKGISLNTDYENSNVEIESDSDKFEHIIQNLLSNAIKFTEKGSISISTKDEGDNLQVTVEDTGIGIAKNHLPYIFDEFRQADASTSRKYGGTGLGLAIAKKYSKMLQGSIRVSSVLGKGTIFTLIISKKIKSIEKPNIHKLPKRVKLSNSKKEYEVHESKHILVIDDNEAIRIQLSNLLEEDNYTTALAKDEKEAFKELAKEKPDLILLDIVLPDVDGFKILEEIRNSTATANIPVMVITSKQISKEELQNLNRNNVHQYIQKGNVNQVDLLNAVGSALFSTTNFEKGTNDITEIPNKPLILIVEDNPDNMITVVALLKDDFRLIKATDGMMGVSKAIEYTPDLILMDIALPKLDGIQAFKEIRKYPELQNTPIIALTASAMKQDRNTILAHGFTAFIAKPISEKSFMKKIREVLYGE